MFRVALFLAAATLFGANSAVAITADAAMAPAASTAGIQVAQAGTPAPAGAPPAAILAQTIPGDILFQPLFDRLPEVARVIVETRRYTQTFEVRDGIWVSVENEGFPITQDTLNRFFFGMSMLVARALQPADHDPAAMGVLEPGAEGDGARIEIQTADGTKLTEFIVGLPAENAATERGGTFIRLVDENETWLVDGPLVVPAFDTEWFTPIVSYTGGQIGGIIIMRGDTVLFDAPKVDLTTNDFDLDHVDPAIAPAGADANDRALRVMSQAFGTTAFEAARHRSGLVVPDDAYKVEFETITALRITITLVEADGVTWALYDAYAPPDSPAVREEAPFNQRLGQWAFRLPESRLRLLTPDIATLVTVP